MNESVIFGNVRVIKPVKVGFQPYRDYIGSRLEIVNVKNGRRYADDRRAVPFEAPNWLPDGSSLSTTPAVAIPPHAGGCGSSTS